MSEESQRVWSQFQTPPARYAAAADWAGELGRFAPIVRLRLIRQEAVIHPLGNFDVARAGRLFDHFPK